MLGLIAKNNCPVCLKSENLLNSYNIKFEILNIEDPETLKIAQKFGIRSAGNYLYDSEKDSVCKVSEYLDQYLQSNK